MYFPAIAALAAAPIAPMMSSMLPWIVGLALLALFVAVFAVGLRAARTRVLAACGLMPAGATLAAISVALVQGPDDLVARIALCAGSIAAGLAHGVVFSIAALPPRRVWMRMLFVPVGMWTGTFVALWFTVPYHGWTMRVLVIGLGALTLTAWTLLPFWSRERGFVMSGARRVPTVRFPCPRCGTRVDWSQGVAACTDCGLFLHIRWPAEPIAPTESAAHAEPTADRARHVRFACPSCGTTNEWHVGESRCSHCGLALTLHWNVHKLPPARG